MKKRVLSALLVLCMACGLVSTAWAADGGQATRETAEKPGIMLLDAEGMDQQPPADPTATPSASPAADPTATPAPTAEPTAEPSATPDATEATEVTATPAPENSENTDAEPTATPDATPSTSMNTKVEIDGQTVDVLVDVPEGAFDEGVNPVLHATAVTGEDADKAAETVAEQTGATFDGMFVLDVYFTDGEDGVEEIEPAKPVSVRFELPEAVLPEDIDASTLTVHHLAEEKDEAGKPVTDENGEAVVNVETVATATTEDEVEGVVALSAEAAEKAEAPAEVARIDELPELQAEVAEDAEEEAEEPGAVAQFEVDGFSVFMITWSGNYTVTVHYVDQDGNELTNTGFTTQEVVELAYNQHGDNEINFKDDYANPAQFEANNNTYTFQYAKYNGWQEYRQTVTRLVASQRYRYYPVYTFYNGNQTVDTLNSDSSDKTVDVYLVYTVTPNSDEHLTIRDSIANDGLFTAVLSSDVVGEGDSVTYKWERSLTGEENSWQEVTSQTVTDDKLNWDSENTPNQINVALDAQLVDTVDNQRYIYRATATVTHSNGSVSTYTATQQVPYYIQLQNGSFEYPDAGATHIQIPNDTDGLIWKTTGEGGSNHQGADIEIAYGTDSPYGAGGAADGNQFAELNCEAYGALYQDVMTVPGSTLNWSLAHLARKNDNNAPDTMALVIMPEDQADEVVEQLTDVANNDRLPNQQRVQQIQQILTQIDGQDGVYVKEFTSGTRASEGEWQVYSSNDHGSETYTVPDGQYLTRFFFVAVSTGSGNATVGNLLDDVWFSTHMQPPADDEARLIVSKTVSGLDWANLPDTYSVTLKVDAQGTEDDENVVFSKADFTANDDGTYTASKTITYKVTANTGSQTVTVTESGGSVTGYTVSTSYKVDDSEAQQASTTGNVTVPAKETVEVAFTNAYTSTAPKDVPISTGKRADRKEDGTYDLSLSVSGDIATVGGEATKADIIFIIDRSSSMWDSYGGNGSMSNQSRMQVLKNAISSAVDKIEADGIDARYAAVQFGMEAQYFDWGDWSYKSINFNQVIQDWTDDAAKLKATVNGISVDYRVESDNWGWSGVGTNVQAGIRLANNDLLNDTQNGPREGAKTFVILLSDGAASKSYDDDGDETDSGDHEQRAVDEIKNTNCDYFYAIGVSNGYNEDFLNDLRDNVNATKSQTLKADNTDDLDAAFDELIQDMTFYAAQNVVMHDTLSKWVEVPDEGNVQFTVKLETRNVQGEWVTTAENTKTVPGTNGENYAMFTTTSQNEEGTSVPDQVYIIPTYNAETKSIEVKLAASADGSDMTYALAPGYRYTVSLVIQPNQDAINAGMDDTDAGHTPDADTGTHSNNSATTDVDESQKGFWSNDNDNAYVSYNVGTNENKKNFPRPVVQVPAETYGNLTLKKEVVDGSTATPTPIADPQVAGTTEGSLVDATYTFTVTATGELADKVANKSYPTENPTITFGSVTGTGDTRTASGPVTVPVSENGVTIVGLPTGTYTITEVNPALEITSGEKSYYYDTQAIDHDGVAEVDKDTSCTVTVTNTYKPYRSITIQKMVDGELGDKTMPFTFTTTVQRGTGTGAVYIDATSVTVNGDTVNASLNPQKGLAQDKQAAFDPNDDSYTLAHNESITITKLKDGDIIVINEPDAEGDGYDVSYLNEANDTLDSDATYQFVVSADTDGSTITVKNFHDIIPATGLESNHTAPYTLMVTAAGIAGLALIGTIVARRIRRRREE